jgi:hypothetical protein
MWQLLYLQHGTKSEPSTGDLIDLLAMRGLTLQQKVFGY